MDEHKAGHIKKVQKGTESACNDVGGNDSRATSIVRGKRGRTEDSVTSDFPTVNEEQAGCSEPLPLVEEIVEIEERKTVLVRLPFLDFFRNAHVCETAPPAHGSVSSGDVDDNMMFTPSALRFEPGTLESPHPIAVLQTKRFGDLVFRGTWISTDSRACDGATISNRAVVHFDEKGGERLCVSADVTTGRDNGAGDAAGGFPLAAARKLESVAGARDGIASLLKHPPVGVTADEARGKKERTGRWVYDRIDVPCSTLVLERIK